MICLTVYYIYNIACKSVLHIPIMHADDVHVRIEVKQGNPYSYNI